MRAKTLEGLKALHSSRHAFGYSAKRLAESDLKGRIGNPELATQDAVNGNFTVGIEG
jgi:taurine dioxygenase